MADNFDMVSGATLKMGEENQDTGRRQAFRAEPPGVFAHIRGIDGFFSVNDISAGGLNLKLRESDLCVNPGNLATLDILIANRRYLTGLQAQVVRVVNMEAAMAFHGLNRHQELKLDKLVLEMQKRVIAQLKSEREAQEARQGDADGAPDAASSSIRLTL